MASTGNLECEVCGGTDFLKESGYFYCKECQTQSQEVREHVFQDENPNVNKKSTRKVQESKKDKKENNLTSWECYNVVICSLARELINLGASKELKPVTKCLWLKYLEKLEVLNLQRDVKPKLQLVNYKRDMNILYDVKKKRRKRKKSSSDESLSTTSHIGSLKRERTKRKTALVRAEYEELSQKSTRDSSSLHNISLSSLKGSDQSLPETSIQFNLFGIKELNKSAPSKTHVKEHKKDILLDLKCHLGYEHTSQTYQDSIKFLSPIKLYCILYLGLLIVKDKIQLGDLFRFIREGHLSFNKYTHLFPETYSSKHMNIQNNNKNVLYAHKRFREQTAKMAHFLNVTAYVEVPNLVALSQRYCQEMNLPDAVFKAVENLISKTEPKLKFTTRHCKIIPNYEGRVVSMIIFILKLLFGLDGLTEFHFSNFAQCINRKVDTQMFDINEWLQYIGYRQILINKYHLPSGQLNDSPIDSDLFLQYLKSHGIQLENDEQSVAKQMKEYTKLLTILKDLQADDIAELVFPPSLTPYLKYSDILSKERIIKLEHSKDLLKYDFTKTSIDFLLFPNTYCELITSDVHVKNGGANDNWIMEEFKSHLTVTNFKYKNRKLIPVEITRYADDGNINVVLNEPEKNSLGCKFNSDYIQKQYHECRKHIFTRNATYLKKICGQVKVTADNIDSPLDQYKNHYNPYERYWLYLLNGNSVSKKDIDRFINDNTISFKLIFQECSRLVEQSYKDLLDEFNSTELFLVFSANYSKTSDKSKFKIKRYLNDGINYYVTQAESRW